MLIVAINLSQIICCEDALNRIIEKNIGCSWTKKKETWIKIHLQVSTNRPSNNWALASVVQKVDSAIHWKNLYPLDSTIIVLSSG